MTLQQAVMLVLQASILMTVFGIGLQAAQLTPCSPCGGPRSSPDCCWRCWW